MIGYRGRRTIASAIAAGEEIYHGDTEDTEKKNCWAHEARHSLLLRVLRASVVNLPCNSFGAGRGLIDCLAAA